MKLVLMLALGCFFSVVSHAQSNHGVSVTVENAPGFFACEYGYRITEQNGVISVRRDGAPCANGVQFVTNLNSDTPTISCRTETLGGLGNYCQGRANIFGDSNEDVLSKTLFKANSVNADVANFIAARRELFAFLNDAVRLAQIEGDRGAEQQVIGLKSALQQKLR